MLLDGDKAAANISVSKMDMLWQGQPKKYLQLGTVMTDEKYRNKGLARFLMETILEEWTGKCDNIYLFANETVLDFYPKFGFHKEVEYQLSATIQVRGKAGRIKKLNMNKETDRILFKTYYEKSNPLSALSMTDNYELLMFYCSSYRKDCVYYYEELDAVVIAMREGDYLTCFDIYCDDKWTLADIQSALAEEGVKRVIFAFTPKEAALYETNAITGEDTLFMLDENQNIFKDSHLMFPALSHA